MSYMAYVCKIILALLKIHTIFKLYPKTKTRNKIMTVHTNSSTLLKIAKDFPEGYDYVLTAEITWNDKTSDWEEWGGNFGENVNTSIVNAGVLQYDLEKDFVYDYAGMEDDDDECENCTCRITNSKEFVRENVVKTRKIPEGIPGLHKFHLVKGNKAIEYYMTFPRK